MALFYVTIAFLATATGAVVGVGGGVIIKPVLDCLGDYPVATNSLLSSCTVWTMTIVAVARQQGQLPSFDGRLLAWLGLGALLGGWGGEWLLQWLLYGLSGRRIMLLQNALLAGQLIFVYFYMRRDKHQYAVAASASRAVLLGAGLGASASFIGIGGGPINIAALAGVLALPVKTAALYSLSIIFISQTAKLAAVTVSQSWGQYDLTLLPYLALAGVLGGWAGSWLQRRLPESGVLQLFQTVLLLLLGLALYNIGQAV